MRSIAMFLRLLLAISAAHAGEPATAASDTAAARPLVVLLHGLARSASSMQTMAQALEAHGYRVCNLDYPSREHAIAVLAAQFVAPQIARCVADPAEPVNFVTHSLGGIIVRELATAGLVQHFGRVVMLGPPNQGSEVVDQLADWRAFDVINGPAGRELGTADGAVPRTLGPAAFELGVVAGNRSINWINSLMIPGADDGTVSVESARLQGMQDFIVVNTSHPFLMMDAGVIEQTIVFLRTGCFSLVARDGPVAQAAQCVPAVAADAASPD